MIDLQFLSDLAMEAGEAILEVYETKFDVEQKEDRTPLTLADKRSHKIIQNALQARYPDIPVLSEEGREVPYTVRSKWNRFWLVDPLDGTKEFIKRNGEFTVNIALVEGNTPIVGVILIPVMGRLFLAEQGSGCWEVAGGKRREVHVSDPPRDAPVRVVKSRSHPSPGLEELLKKLPGHEGISRGSALKFCAVATGEADFYPRLGPTWEWDTAAGHAILTTAGGVLVGPKGEPFTYNKPNLVNGPFLAASSLEWMERAGVLAGLSSPDLQ